MTPDSSGVVSPPKRLDEVGPRFTRDGRRLVPSSRPAPRAQPGVRPSGADSVAAQAGAVVAKPLILAAMFLILAFMWIGAPVLWLWLVSHLAPGTAPRMDLYLLVFVGWAATVAVSAQVLHVLDKLYCRASGRPPSGSVRYGHMRPSCEGPRSGRRSATPLDVVAAAVVLMALGALAAWFFLAAGSPLAA